MSSTSISFHPNTTKSPEKCDAETCQGLSTPHLLSMLPLFLSNCWVIQSSNPNLKGSFLGSKKPDVLVWVPSESQTWDKDLEGYSLLKRQSQK